MRSQPFFIPALLLLLFALPLVLGLIPRNRVYGIRTAQTLADPHLWYRANRAGGWLLLLSSLFYLSIAAMVPNTPSTGTDLRIWFLHLGAFLFPLLASLRRMRKYVKHL